jgi:type I restriction enzyme S subunit
MAKITPCFENAKSCVFSGLPNGIGAGTTELHIFRNSFNSVAPIFLLYYLKNPNYISRAVPKMTGSAGQKRVPTPYFTEQLFPLPPLSEQHRIVARIDQLMARCDSLEKLRKEREEKRLAVHAAAIKQLLDTSDGSAWDFIEQHFGELYTVKSNVAELRKAILQLAVMGRLVPQDAGDPPASELLKKIEAQKQRLVKAGKIKKPKPLPSIKLEEMSYALPQGWEWITLQDVGFFLGGKTPSKSKPKYWDGDIPWVSPKDMKCLEITDSEDHVTAAGVESGLAMIPEQSILMVVRSGILRRMFPVAVNNLPCTINQDLKALVPYLKAFSSYLLLMLRGFEQFILEKLTKQGVTVESVKFDEFANTKFPLPPLPEQHRIVARIDQLMALCDTVDQQIDAVTGKQNELLGAVMAQV